jgi:hypothetical protein
MARGRVDVPLIIAGGFQVASSEPIFHFSFGLILFRRGGFERAGAIRRSLFR